MIVTRVQGRHFMAYDALDVELPEVGLVVVTGKNWQGKSALAEAVAVAYWGRTLRGTDPWRPGTAGWVQAETRDLYAKRSSTKKGTKRLEWSTGRPGASSEGSPTPSKAQATLEEVVGPLDVWRKCSVFSSSDAALFTEATDKQRKQLLEGILGIGRFDAALEACRQDLKAAERQATGSQNRLEIAEGSLEVTRQALADAQAALADLPPPTTPADRAELAKYKERAAEAVAEIDRLRRQAEKHQGAVEADRKAAALSEAASQQAARELDRFKSGKCPTCGQAVGPEVLAPLEGEIDRNTRAAKANKANAEGKVKQALKHLGQLQEALGQQIDARDLAHRKVAEIQGQIGVAKQIEATRQRLEAQVAREQARIGEVMASLDLLRQEVEAATTEVGILEACTKVLGLKGVRAQILGHSLEGLEGIANMHLRRTVPEIEAGIRLRPFTELKSKAGEYSDSISLGVEGWGGGEHGYKATSGGARRLINISILLGLATVSDAARGLEPGDLWFDEVFDALDEDRVVAVGDIIQEIARERKVVVISHHRALVEHLEPAAALRLNIEGHQVQRR